MARLIKYGRECDWPECSRKAQHELRDVQDQTIGWYCDEHGEEKLAEVESLEKKS